MTIAELIYQRSLELPEAAAHEALDFIDFLGQRYASPEKEADASAAYEAWFRGEIQRALEDARPGLADEEVRAHFLARRESLRSKLGT